MDKYNSEGYPDPAAYEVWAKTTDIPGVNALENVNLRV